MASRFVARSVAVLAPHADDEVFGCGAAIASLREDGARVRVLVVSDGAGDEPDPERRREIAAARLAESAAALEHLGGASVVGGGFPDRGLGERVAEVAEWIVANLSPDPPELVLLPSPVEIHPDHRAVAEAFHAACRGPRGEALRKADVAYYEISQPIRPNFLLDATRHAGAKDRAMEAFASQLAGHDYAAFVRGLNAYRRMTLPRGVAAAEGYHVVPGPEHAGTALEDLAGAIGPARPGKRRQPVCIRWLREAVMRLRKSSFVLFLGLLTVLAASTPAAAQGRGGGGPHPGGGSTGGGGYRGHYGGYYRGYYPGSWGPGWGWGGYWGPSPFWGGGVVVLSSSGPGGRPAPARFAAVDVEVKPDTAEVFLDGVFVGKADDFDGYPDYLYLLPGKYQVELRHPLYQPVKIDLEVKRGQKVELARELKLLPGKGKLDAFDPPDRGTPLGRVFGPRATPVDPRVRARSAEQGDYGVDAELDRPAPRQTRPAPRKNGRPRIEWKVAPGDASVYLDDQFIGTAEDLNTGSGTRVEPGTHTVTVVRPGFKTKTFEVEGKPSALAKVSVELEK